MEFKAILNTEIGLLYEAEIAGLGSFFHPVENKAREDVTLLQFLHPTAKAVGHVRNVVHNHAVSREIVLFPTP